MESWSEVPRHTVLAYLAAACLLGWLANTGAQWVPLLDSANLAFHEAGHLIYGLLAARLAVYGGTLGQLTFPVVAIWVFQRQASTASLSYACLWLGENLFNIARYMADARTQSLPLVGGGDHDWAEIFGRWGVLGSDTLIAGVVRALGWFVIVAAGLWLWRRSNSAD